MSLGDYLVYLYTMTLKLRFWLNNSHREMIVIMCFKASLPTWAGSGVLPAQKQKFFENIWILAVRKHHLASQRLSDHYKWWLWILFQYCHHSMLLKVIPHQTSPELTFRGQCLYIFFMNILSLRRLIRRIYFLKNVFTKYIQVEYSSKIYSQKL